jgi:hypothetical protein
VSGLATVYFSSCHWTNEPLDISAEAGTAWFQGINAVLDMYTELKKPPKLAYPEQAACQQIQGFSQIMSETYKKLGDKGLTEKASKLADATKHCTI